MALLKDLAGSGAAMEMIITIAWVVGVISIIVFIALFGRLPIFRRTPIGWLHRLIAQQLPNALIALDRALTGGYISSRLIATYNYLMNDRHPVVLILFLILQAGSEILFLPGASPFLSSTQKFLVIPVLVSSPYYTLYRCYTTSGHHITEDSYPAALRRYPYDYTLYHPHQICRTCQRPKPARSKHCSICKTCIERQDHHCIWINNCVGLHNYHYFIALLVSIAALLGYGMYTGFGVLDTMLQRKFIPAALTRGSRSSKRWSTGLSWYEWMNVYSIVIAQNPGIGAVSLLAAMTFPLALGFLVYHAYLVWAGCTTNETAKWTDLREDIWDKLVWKARIADVARDYPGPIDERIVYSAEHYRDQDKKTGQRPQWTGGTHAEWWIIQTRNGSQPTRWRAKADGGHEEVMDHRWMRVDSLKDLDNLYDMGLAGNLRDTMLAEWKSYNS